METSPEPSGWTVNYLEGAESRSQALGLNVPSGVCLLPRNYFSAQNAAELVYDGSVPDVKVLLRQEKISLDTFAPPGTIIPYEFRHDATWIGPVLFFGVAAWSENSALINIVLGIIANYPTDYFKGQPGSHSVSLSIAIEQTDKKKTVSLNYSGPLDGLKTSEKIIRDAMK